MRNLRWLTVPVIAVALLSTACKSGDDSEDSGDTADATTTTATATATEGGSEATATESSSGGGDAADLADIFAGFQNATFNVTYQLESDASAEDAMSGTWNWIRDNDNERTRFEVEFAGDKVIMITTPEQSLLCSDGACFDASGVMGAAMPNIGDMFTQSIDEVQAQTTSATVHRIDGRTIAGVDAECVEFEDTAEGASGTACYAEGGIPLLIDSETSDGNFHLEATSFSKDVSDSDFEAPFPVTRIGG